MKDVVLQKIEEVKAELQALGQDHGKLTGILREIEQKIIFANGKLLQLNELLQSLEPSEPEAPTEG